jgi:Zn finger protein HypA/HybF involved in hydrogenase expression
MHETVIAKQIIEEAMKHGKVKEITIEVGDIAHLPANEMKEVMQNMTKWKIIVKQKKAKVKCDCGYTGEPKIIEKKHGFVLFECPKCGSMPKVLEGEDIIIKEVKVE